MRVHLLLALYQGLCQVNLGWSILLVARWGTPTTIVGGIHQADKLRHCCLMRLSTHMKPSRIEAVSTYTYLRKTHMVGLYRKRVPFIYSNTFRIDQQLPGFSLLPLNLPSSTFTLHEASDFPPFRFCLRQYDQG